MSSSSGEVADEHQLTGGVATLHLDDLQKLRHKLVALAGATRPMSYDAWRGRNSGGLRKQQTEGDKLR